MTGSHSVPGWPGTLSSLSDLTLAAIPLPVLQGAGSHTCTTRVINTYPYPPSRPVPQLAVSSFEEGNVGCFTWQVRVGTPSQTLGCCWVTYTKPTLRQDSKELHRHTGSTRPPCWLQFLKKIKRSFPSQVKGKPKDKKDALGLRRFLSISPHIYNIFPWHTMGHSPPQPVSPMKYRMSLSSFCSCACCWVSHGSVSTVSSPPFGYI